MITKGNIRAAALGLLLGSSILVVQRIWGDIPARWVAGALLLAALVDMYVRYRVSRSGYWITRGVDSEVGEPCWLVKGGPFVCHEDDTVAELGSWWQARRYVARSERLMTEAIQRRARG